MYGNNKSQRINNLDALLERERSTRFVLKSQDDNFIYQPEKRRFSFYQFCRMHNPGRTARNNGKKVHEMRKLIYDEEHNILEKKEALISAKKLDKFINKIPSHKFTLYETYEISLVDIPSDLEVFTAGSAILNGDSHTTGNDVDPNSMFSNNMLGSSHFVTKYNTEFDFY
jgi:hypothetical protein